MERSFLKPAPAPPAARTAPITRATALAQGLALLGLGLAATALGADSARRPSTAADRATAIVAASLGSDPIAAESPLPLRAIRADVGRRPLDARTRALYAGLLLDRAGDEAGRAIATFHAARAADLAPVTVPVVRAAVVVLARAGATEEALDRVRAMFLYDPGTAAELLASIEPFLPAASIERGIADEPAAWLGWAQILSRSGRPAESEGWLSRGLGRWPGDPGLLEEAVGRAASQHDWTSVDRLLPRDAPALPPRLLALRAWSRAERGDRDGARADVAEALRAPRDPNLLSVAAEALAAAGQLDEAGTRLREALYRLPSPPASQAMRLSLLTRLARLEDRRDRPGDALRAWRAVLAVNPAHEEARRRVIALGGSPP